MNISWDGMKIDPLCVNVFEELLNIPKLRDKTFYKRCMHFISLIWLFSSAVSND